MHEKSKEPMIVGLTLIRPRIEAYAMDAPARQVFRQALKTDTQISQRLDAYVVECHVAAYLTN